MDRHHSQDPAEGSREIVDRELARSKPRHAEAGDPKPVLQDLERMLPELSDSSLAELLALDPKLSDIEEAMVWHSRFDGDEAHQWFRARLLQTASAMEPIGT